MAGASNKVKADSAGRVFVLASFWKETSVEVLNKLPYDLNDNKIYQLPAGAILDDQWRWSRYKTGSMKQLIIDERSIGSKKCYYQHCLGSHFCPNLECGNKRLTLFASVVCDCVESAKLNAQYRLILRGHPINTTGPSDHQTHQRELAEERSQTSTVTNQILESLRAEPSDVLATFDSYTQKTDPRRTSRIDKLKNSEQSIGSDSRPFGYPYRSTQSNSFKESLSHVFPPETGMKYLITSYTKEINLIAINMRGERDKVCVKMSSIPHCNCTFRVKKPKAVCRNIIFVLLFICNLHPTSPVIHQIAYSQNELKEILGGAPSGIENLSADLRG